MAVAKMKLMSIIGPLDEFDDVVRDCLIDSNFYIENAMNLLSGVKGLYQFEQTNPLEEHLKKAVSLCELMGIEPDYRAFDRRQADYDAIMDYMTALEEEYGSLKEKLEQNNRTINQDEHIIEQLKHFSSLSLDIDTFFNSKYVKYRFGRIPVFVYYTYRRQIESSRYLFFFPTSSEEEYVYGMVVTSREYEDKADAQMASLQFERIHISGRVKGAATEVIAEMAGERKRLSAECGDLQSRLTEIAAREKDALLSHYAYIKYMHDTYDIRRYCVHSSDTFYAIGWTERDSVDEFTRNLERHPKLLFSFDDPEIFIKKLTPPSKLKNLKIFKPFQAFVEIYGMPNYKEIDPTPLFALTYPIIFGIMFGDVGQGLVILLASLLYYLKKKDPIVLAFTFSGFFSTLFGFVYGSCFGSETLLGYEGFRVLTTANTNTILLTAVGLGIVLMTISMIINVINGIRQRSVEKAVFNSHGIVGLIFYLAVVVGAVLMLKGNNILTPVYILLLIVLPLLLIYVKEPLVALAERKKWEAESKGEYFLTSFFELFEVLISFLSNTISFIRVGAFAISHAGLMMVVYSLSQTSGGSDNLLVIIIGNLFVMALEGLIVGIQVLRLEFYELFGKFYEGDGRQSEQISIQYRINSQRR